MFQTTIYAVWESKVCLRIEMKIQSLTAIFITENMQNLSCLAKVIFYCRFYFLGNISNDKYYGM
jgi:hypothetical protein